MLVALWLMWPTAIPIRPKLIRSYDVCPRIVRKETYSFFLVQSQYLRDILWEFDYTRKEVWETKLDYTRALDTSNEIWNIRFWTSVWPRPWVRCVRKKQGIPWNLGNKFVVCVILTNEYKVTVCAQSLRCVLQSTSTWRQGCMNHIRTILTARRHWTIDRH